MCRVIMTGPVVRGAGGRGGCSVNSSQSDRSGPADGSTVEFNGASGMGSSVHRFCSVSSVCDTPGTSTGFSEFGEVFH